MDTENMWFTLLLSCCPIARAARMLAPSPMRILTQLNSMLTGMVMFIAEIASGPIMWLTMTASVVTASCEASEVSIEAARKFLNALDITNELRVFACMVICFLSFCAKLMINLYTLVPITDLWFLYFF